MEADKRRLRIIHELYIRKYDTLQHLANEFDVSVTSIEKDLGAISDLLPHTILRGRCGGVYVDKDYCAEVMRLTGEDCDILIHHMERPEEADVIIAEIVRTIGPRGNVVI